MSKLKARASALLEKIRNPATDEHEQHVRQNINTKRLLFLIPFIVAAAIFLIMWLNS